MLRFYSSAIDYFDVFRINPNAKMELSQDLMFLYDSSFRVCTVDKSQSI